MPPTFPRPCLESKRRQFLFVVGGLGLGNSTRCDSLIRELVSRGQVVDVATWGNGEDYFRGSAFARKVFCLLPISYGSAGGRISAVRTVGGFPRIVASFLRNVFRLKRLLASSDYDAVVIDSDYSFFFLRPFVKQPVIAINNARQVIEACARLPRLPATSRFQYWVERIDSQFHDSVPDLVLAPSFTDRRAPQAGRIRKLPPLIRPELLPSPAKDHIRCVVVMVGGSPFSSPLDFLGDLKLIPGIQIHVLGKEGSSDSVIRYHGRTYENWRQLNEADAVIINGGHSSISEAVALGKPALVIPIAGHVEQTINARLYEETGRGLSASESDACKRFRVLMEKYPEFLQANRVTGIAGGRELAAREIELFLASGVRDDP